MKGNSNQRFKSTVSWDKAQTLLRDKALNICRPKAQILQQVQKKKKPNPPRWVKPSPRNKKHNPNPMKKLLTLLKNQTAMTKTSTEQVPPHHQVATGHHQTERLPRVQANQKLP